MQLSSETVSRFQNFIWQFYAQEGRLFAWRNIDDAYKIFVSEVMLQQTQTHRVEKKYEQFVSELFDFQSLASASLKDVLFLWQGLGYNRRALYLKNSAVKVVKEFGGVLPSEPELLQSLPGIGYATARSLCAFVHNKPVVFIETNVRAVFIHEFFKDETNVHDKQLLPLIEQTVDHSNPREWYYALMDYGVHLKKTKTNPSRKSVHHVKQSKFEGSDRQIRGRVVKLLTEQGAQSFGALCRQLGAEEKRLQKILNQLQKDLLIKKSNNKYLVA